MTAPTATKRGRMKVLTAPDGDREVTWDKGKPDEVDDARATFDNHVKKKGNNAYAWDPSTGRQGQQIKEFDPNLEKIILTPALQGG